MIQFLVEKGENQTARIKLNGVLRFTAKRINGIWNLYTLFDVKIGEFTSMWSIENYVVEMDK